MVDYLVWVMTYRHGLHTVFIIHLHLVWIVNYQEKVLVDSVGLRVRDMIREICQAEEVDIIKGQVLKDHVHLVVPIPPQVTISRLAQKLKGMISFKLRDEFPLLRKTYWRRYFWARGYFCCSSGNVMVEIIIHNIREPRCGLRR